MTLEERLLATAVPTEAAAVPPAVLPASAKIALRWAARAAAATVVALLALFILGPLVWLSLWAFAGSWQFPSLLPSSWTLYWWRTVLSTPGLDHSIALSFLFAPIVTAISAVICIPAAYAFARQSFPGRKALLVSLFATNAFPKIGLYITMAGMFYTLHLMSTFFGVVLVQLIGTVVFMTWVPAAAFASVPRSLEEAAQDVGAGRLRTFCKITLPLALPGILVAMILSFLASFDESQGTFLVGTPKYITMPVQMYSLVLNYPQQAAAVFSILLSVPSVVLLLLVRRHIMGGRLAEGFQLK
jgi:putative spermidine/putrescine transport system permease protein